MTILGIVFDNPYFLLLLALLPIWMILRGRQGKQAAVEYSSASLLRHIGRPAQSKAGAFINALRMLALACLIVALARPQVSDSRQEVEASGVDMMLAVDISGSMEAEDFTKNGQPDSRINVVKDVVQKFIDERPNDRIGIIAFAGRPYLISPLTLDHDWLKLNLERVQLGLAEDGTAIGSGIASALTHLAKQKAKSKVIVLLTDGVNNTGKASPETAAEMAKTLGVKVYTIGAGAEGQAPIPVTDQFGNRRMRMMKVDVDEDALKKIAATTGGQFFRATDTNSLRNIYDQIDKMEKTTATVKKFENRHEVFAYALIPGLILLGLELGLSHTRFRRLP